MPIGSEESTITASQNPSGASWRKTTPVHQYQDLRIFHSYKMNIYSAKHLQSCNGTTGFLTHNNIFIVEQYHHQQRDLLLDHCIQRQGAGRISSIPTTNRQRFTSKTKLHIHQKHIGKKNSNKNITLQLRKKNETRSKGVEYVCMDVCMYVCVYTHIQIYRERKFYIDNHLINFTDINAFHRSMA